MDNEALIKTLSRAAWAAGNTTLEAIQRHDRGEALDLDAIAAARQLLRDAANGLDYITGPITVARACSICYEAKDDVQIHRRHMLPESPLCGACYASALAHAHELRDEVTR
ncbi:MAG: hypothetical protein ABWY78_06470 [Microvirga sp.]